MKYTIILYLSFWLPDIALAQQGGSCSNPFPLAANGTIQSFLPSTTTGSSVVCTAYTNNGPVTWFSFTTNAQAECPLLNITASNGGWCEIAMYNACNGGQALQTASSMCFDDGTGLWAPAETQTLQPNTTYLLRIKTATTDSIKIAAQYHTPSNNFCSGATSISTASFTDNNACHHPGTGVFADQLCAFTLENTAFYHFYVATPGSAIINISSISCDNGSGNNTSGFQIGFFKGNCGALIPVNCTSGTGNFVQASTDPLPAGTHVYVAIDGMAGSNCLYSISGINVFGVLAAAQLKNFSAWIHPVSNLIRWESKNEQSLYYEVERSANGTSFSSIGKLVSDASGSVSVNYSFEDKSPLPSAYYRLKQFQKNGDISLSQVIRAERKPSPYQLEMINPVQSSLEMYLLSPVNEQLNYSISNLSGQVMMKGIVQARPERTMIYRNIAELPAGRYVIQFQGKEISFSRSFIKL